MALWPRALPAPVQPGNPNFTFFYPPNEMTGYGPESIDGRSLDADGSK
jgi:hypothetical protein